MRMDRVIRHAAVLFVVCLAMVYLWLRSPANREDTSALLDFSEFYAAGEMVRHGLGSRLYDLRLQAEFQLQVAPVHAFYLRPPFEAVLFVPFTYLSYRTAYTAWILLSLALLFGVTKITQMNTNVQDAMRRYARGIPVDLGLMFVLFLTFGPTMNCLLIGQDSILILMVYTLVYLALKRNRELEAGGLLAFGLFKFHLVLPFVIVFALRRRGSFLLGFAVIALVLVAISVLVSGPGVLAAYPEMFLNPGYRKLMSFQPEYAANIRGFVHLIGGSKLPAVFSVVVITAVSAFLLWITARNWKDNEFDLSFSAAVIATLLTGFHSFVYDLSLLLLPLAVICGELAKRSPRVSTPTFNAALIILFLPPVHHLLIVYHVYALMSVVVLALFASVIKIAASQPARQTLPLNA